MIVVSQPSGGPVPTTATDTPAEGLPVAGGFASLLTSLLGEDGCDSPSARKDAGVLRCEADQADGQAGDPDLVLQQDRLALPAAGDVLAGTVQSSADGTSSARLDPSGVAVGTPTPPLVPLVPLTPAGPLAPLDSVDSVAPVDSVARLGPVALEVPLTSGAGTAGRGQATDRGQPLAGLSTTTAGPGEGLAVPGLPVPNQRPAAKPAAGPAATASPGLAGETVGTPGASRPETPGDLTATSPEVVPGPTRSLRRDPEPGWSAPTRATSSADPPVATTAGPVPRSPGETPLGVRPESGVQPGSEVPAVPTPRTADSQAAGVRPSDPTPPGVATVLAPASDPRAAMPAVSSPRPAPEPTVDPPAAQGTGGESAQPTVREPGELPGEPEVATSAADSPSEPDRSPADRTTPVPGSSASPLGATTGDEVSEAGRQRWGTPASTAYQLTEQIAPLRMGPDGVRRLVVRLQPEELGTVHVVAEIRGGEISLQLTGATDAGRQALAAGLPHLRRELAEAGFDQCALSLGTGGQDQTMADTGDRAGQQWSGNGTTAQSHRDDRPAPEEFPGNDLGLEQWPAESPVSQRGPELTPRAQSRPAAPGSLDLRV